VFSIAIAIVIGSKSFYVITVFHILVSPRLVSSRLIAFGIPILATKLITVLLRGTTSDRYSIATDVIFFPERFSHSKNKNPLTRTFIDNKTVTISD